MTRYLKALGLTLFAALAISAVMASAASAVPFKVKSSLTKPVITSSADGKISLGFNLGKLSCTIDNEVGVDGEEEGEEVELLLTPTYEECSLAGVPAKIDTNGCEEEFDPVDKDANGNFEGEVEIICPTKSMEITAEGCTITIPAQKKLLTMTFQNKGTGNSRELTVERNITKLTYTEDPVGATPSCPTKTTRTDGTFSGASTLTAETDKGVMGGLWVE
jgi:hypothetical protein